MVMGGEEEVWEKTGCSDGFIKQLLSVSGSLTQFDLSLISTTTATLWALKFCTVICMYLMNMTIFFVFLL